MILVKVSELIEKLGLTLVTNPDYTDRDVKGCYVGDLLSWVMGRAEQDCVWSTIMSNINIIAVAALVDMSCIILAEGVSVDEEIIKKADSQGIIILSTQKTCYQTAVEIHQATGI